MEKGVPIRSITRAIAALKVINCRGSLSMMQIARAIDLPYPTACRIVQTLMHEGLVEQEPARKYYRPTAMVEALSSGFQQDSRLIAVARPHITALTNRIGWPVSITVRVGNKMVLRDSTHAHTSLTFDQYYPGFTLPILESASGKLSLAYESAVERSSIIKSLRDGEDIDGPCMAIAESSVNVDQILRQGYALHGRNNFNFTPGKTASIAVPIFVDDEFEAALTMVFFVAAMNIASAVGNYIDDLKMSAAKISTDLTDGDCRSTVPKYARGAARFSAATDREPGQQMHS